MKIETSAETTEIPISLKVNRIVVKHQKRIEKQLKIKLKIKSNALEIRAKAFSEYIVKEITDALELGFDIGSALMLSNEDYMLKYINLKQHVRPSRLHQVKARIIGEKGKAKRIISELSECEIAVSNSIVAIIGRTENIDIASKAISSLIRGAPHSSVYSLLEKNRRRMREAKELGLEELG